MKNLKKFTSLMMAMVMSVSCMAFTASAVEATDDAEATQQNSVVKVSGDVAHIEDYMEFYNNQDYYIDWARENGYSLFINVPDEYMEMEKQRILGDDYAGEVLTGMVTRGLKAPTAVWDISKKGKYEFSVESSASKIYTNYKFTGQTTYCMTTLNMSNVSSGGTAYGVIDSRKTFSTFGSGTVINFFHTSTLSPTPFYVCFNAPAYLVGSIQ